MSHQRVADVQFVDALDRRHRLNVVVVQAMTGIDDQALGQTKRHAVSDALQFFRDFAGGLRVGITAGVQLDGGRTYAFRCRYLPLIRVDEQRYFTADFRQTVHRSLDPRFLTGNVQTAFGGQFLPCFRDQTDMCRTQTLGEREHFFGDAHFEVHARLQHILEQQYVTLLDMPTVFTQVHGDAIGTRLFSIQRCFHRVWIASTTGLTQGGDMVDVHAKKNASAMGHGSLLEI